MTRHKSPRGGTHGSDKFVTIMCDAPSHEPWGLHTFYRSESGWYESSTLALPSGKRLNKRGDGLAMRELSADQKVLISAEEAAELWSNAPLTDGERDAIIRGDMALLDIERLRPANLRDEPGVYSRVLIRCPRCGNDLPVKFAKLTAALDMLQSLDDNAFIPLDGRGPDGHERATLRRAVVAASRT